MGKIFQKFTIYHLLIFFSGTMALKNVKILIPPIVKSGDTVTLSCLYELEKGPLYTIKWYLNEQEFYRYTPKEEKPQNTYPIQGNMRIDISTSDSHDVTLVNVSKELAGIYKCEISEDYPSYHTSILEGRMEVSDIPDEDPQLGLERSRLSSGDTLKANCTSGAAYPVPNITWSFNDDSKNEAIIKYGKIPVNERLTKAWSDVELKLSSHHFREGQLHLRCYVTIKGVYSATADALIAEDKPLIASITGDASPHSHHTNGADAKITWTAQGAHSLPQGFFIIVLTILLSDLFR